MHRLKLSIVLGSLLIGGTLMAGVPAQAESPLGAFGAAVGVVTGAPNFWGGHHYCWYPSGWHGPGWYWCGYAHRRGHGWGGGEGWHHWHHGHGHGPGHIGHGHHHH